jgi:hypothetical protein
VTATTTAQPPSPPLEPPPTGGSLSTLRWHVRHNPKRELWLSWYVLVIFYNIYFLMIFVVSRAQPPPDPGWDLAGQIHWFQSRHWGLLVGMAVITAILGAITINNALIAYSMRRMSVSPVFAYTYLLIYTFSGVPGQLLLCVALVAGAYRPDRSPELMGWLYDFAFLSFSGTMGVFLIGSLIWMVAILIDKNRVFPKWFGYLNLCNALTEVVVAPAWMFHRGAFAWNGAIGWWINMVVFGVYTGAFIVLLRQMIQREDFGTGPLPELPQPEPAPQEQVR